MPTRFAALAVLLALAVFPAAAAAEQAGTEDVFNQQSFSDPENDGSEVGFETGTTVSRSYNSAAYDFDPQFGTQERERTGCGGGTTFARGGRTAWLRFVPAVKGRLTVSTTTSSYNVMLFAYDTPLARGAKGFSQAELRTINCNDASTGSSEINMPVPSSEVTPGKAILLQTASFCGYSGPSACNGTEIGGPTTLTVEFVPDDTDGDSVPDTKDQCATTHGEAPSGCPPPDTDGDGVPDRSDVCLQEPGVPPTGCPADADGDGVANENDQCIFQFGTNPGGCPDPDGDGVANLADRCPTVKGIARDGCPDDDRDGVSNRVDRCKTQRGTDPDGCPKPLGARFPDLWRVFPTSTRVLKLQVKAPKGSMVQLRCKGRGCKLRRARFKQRRTTHDLRRYLPRSRVLPVGTVLEIRVTAPRTLGTFVRLKIRGSALPRRLDRCIAASGKLRKCPS